MSKKKIKILVSCHADSYVPETEIINAIQVGSAKGHIKSFSCFDDEGENISEKNDTYCELTAQYWAWKNLDSEYYGFCHYRRYLSFSDKRFEADEYKNVMYGSLDDKLVRDFGLDDKSIEEFIGDYDIVVPEPVDLRKDETLRARRNVYAHYKKSPNHDISDFNFVLDYIKKHLPDFALSAKEYASSHFGYFLNMFVMKKDVFSAYCEWLFPILSEFEKQKDFSHCNLYAKRVVGLLAERLFGVYITYLKKNNPEIKIKYTQQCFVRSAEVPYPLPFKKQNNIAVCLGSSEYYTPFAGIVIESIKANANPDYYYDIFVMTNRMSDISKEELLKTVDGAENFSLRFVDGVRYLDGKSLQEWEHIDKTTYLRFSILDFMRNYDKTIYLDCDIVVNRDLSELYNEDIEGCYFGAVKDFIQIGWCNQPNSVQQKYNVDVLGISEPDKYFQAGVLLMNLKELRKDYTDADLYSLAQSRFWRWLDQDVLNYMSKDGKVKFLEEEWNVTAHSFRNLAESPEYSAPKADFDAYKRSRKNPYIVHYAGKHIPCFSLNADLSFLFWQYARKSIFYEKILFYMTNEVNGKTVTDEKTGFLRRVANRLFPKGTKRRAFIKRIFFFVKRKPSK